MNRDEFINRFVTHSLSSIRMRAELDALIEAEVAERTRQMVGLLSFAVHNADKFTEHDPDGVKAGWILSAKDALEGVAK